MNNASLELGGTNWAEKDGNILGYSVGDTSGKYSPQEFTFARGSNLSATRIDRAGLIVKGRENLLTYSNDLNNVVWNHTDVASTGGQSGYDGSNDAWLLNSSSGGNSLRRDISVSGINTFSIYAKAGTANGIRIRFDQDTDCNAYIDLTDGSVFTEGNTLSINVYPISGGWYRISVAMNNIGLNLFRLIVTNGTTITTAGTIYIQDLQLEQGLAASPYIESGATNGTAGVLENTPRLNYTTGVANPYLLLEPSRTNLITQSEYFGSADWAGSGGVVVNTAISPSGYQDADTGNNIYTSTGVGDATTLHANSIFAKANPSGSSILLLRVNRYGSGVDYNECTFNLSNGTASAVTTGGTASSASAEIEDYGNGWYRCILTGIASTTAGVISFNPQNNCFIWGAQVEAGSYPTSYIPTYSVSATRAADVCNKLDASDLIGTEFTLFFDGYQSIESQYSRYIVLKGTAGTYVNFISIETNPNNKVGVNVNAGSSVFTATTQRTSGERLKMALRCKDNDFAFYINGVLIKSQTSGSVPVTSDLYLGYYTDYAENYNVINQTQIYKEALTNAELATLTTI